MLARPRSAIARLAMAGFDFDMAFPVAEVVAGFARLVAQLDYGHSQVATPDGAEFTLTLPGGQHATVRIGPLPPERQTYVSFFPRTLLAVHSDAADAPAIAALRRAVVMAFLRVMG